jgi:hypothetical protein
MPPGGLRPPAGDSALLAVQSGPKTGTEPKAGNPPKIGASQNTELLRHRDPAGKPCLAINGSARPYTVNTNLFDHLITASNSCAQRIRVQVCYFRSQQCVMMDVPGRGRREAVLGTLPSIKDFRFEFRERF